jgi:hypothetical protein
MVAVMAMVMVEMIHHHFLKWFIKNDFESSAPLPPEAKITSGSRASYLNLDLVSSEDTLADTDTVFTGRGQ